jgi:hypothetical protein
MQNPSLRPELEFELLKLVLLREKYIQRLSNKLSADHEKALQTAKAVARAAKLKSKPKGFVEPVLFVPRVDIGLIGLFDVLRDCTVQVVETIRLWERAQLSYPNVVSYKWNGQNYLEKMFSDLEFLQGYPYVLNWMGFSPTANPFLVPPEVLRDEVIVPPNSFIIFGIEPPKESVVNKPKSSTANLKSPYTTPIINDPQVFTHLSARSKLNAKFKAVQGGAGEGDADDQDDNTFQGTYNGTATGSNTLRSSVNSRDGSKRPRLPRPAGTEGSNFPEKPAAGAYQSYLNSELIQKMRACWKILLRIENDATLRNTTQNRVISEYGADPNGAGPGVDYKFEGGLDDAGGYDESRVFASAPLSHVELPSGQIMDDLGAADQSGTGAARLARTTSDFKGLYATSTQTLAALPAGTGGVSSPSALQQMGFQHQKEYFQRSLQDTSGSRYPEQDAANATLRFFPVGASTADSGAAEGSAVVAGATVRSDSGRTAEDGGHLGGPVAMGPGVHLYTEDSAEGEWGSASDAGAMLRVDGIHGVQPSAADVRSGLTPGRVGSTSVEEIGKGLNTTSSQLWTPHEIHLQRQVQRRGGELYVLTAAGTQGRLKAPWRRTRFERLEDDVQHLHQQSDIMHMAVEEALTRAVDLAKAQGGELAPARRGSAVGAGMSSAVSGAQTIIPGQVVAGTGAEAAGSPRVRFAEPASAPTPRAAEQPGITGADLAPAAMRSASSQHTPAEAAAPVPTEQAPAPASPALKRARIVGTGLVAQLPRPVTAPASAGRSAPSHLPGTAAGAASPAHVEATAPAAAQRPATAPRVILTGRGGAAVALPISAPISVAAMAASATYDSGSGTDEEAGTDEEQSDEDAAPAPVSAAPDIAAAQPAQDTPPTGTAPAVPATSETERNSAGPTKPVSNSSRQTFSCCRIRLTTRCMFLFVSWHRSTRSTKPRLRPSEI